MKVHKVQGLRSSHWTSDVFIGAGTAKEGGKHEAKHCAEEFLVGSQPSCDLDHHIGREAQVAESVMPGVDGALSLLLALMAGLSVSGGWLWLAVWCIFWVRPWRSPPY